MLSKQSTEPYNTSMFWDKTGLIYYTSRDNMIPAESIGNRNWSAPRLPAAGQGWWRLRRKRPAFYSALHVKLQVTVRGNLVCTKQIRPYIVSETNEEVTSCESCDHAVTFVPSRKPQSFNHNSHRGLVPHQCVHPCRSQCESIFCVHIL